MDKTLKLLSLLDDHGVKEIFHVVHDVNGFFFVSDQGGHVSEFSQEVLDLLSDAEIRAWLRQHTKPMRMPGGGPGALDQWKTIAKIKFKE